MRESGWEEAEDKTAVGMMELEVAAVVDEV